MTSPLHAFHRILAMGALAFALVGCGNEQGIPGYEGPSEDRRPWAADDDAVTDTDVNPTSDPAPAGVPGNVLSRAYGSGVYLLLRKTGRKTYAGLNDLSLQLVRGTEVLESIPAISGSPRAQQPKDFRVRSSPGLPGSGRPIPEGRYSFGAPVWDGKAAIGPWWIGISPDPLPRGLFGFHLDGNRSSSPGTNGCVGLPDRATLDVLLRWIKGGKGGMPAPRTLYVDWGLGTFPKTTFLARR